MKVTMKKATLLRAKTQCRSHASSDASIHKVVLTIDEPVEHSGVSLVPTLTKSIVATLIDCSKVIANKCAKKRSINISNVHLSTICEFVRRSVLLEVRN